MQHEFKNPSELLEKVTAQLKSSLDAAMPQFTKLTEDYKKILHPKEKKNVEILGKNCVITKVEGNRIVIYTPDELSSDEIYDHIHKLSNQPPKKWWQKIF